MTTLITREQMRPGQIVQRVTTQTFRVRSARWSDDNASKRAGLLKLDHLLPDRTEWQLIRGRWRVRWHPPFSFLGAHNSGFWVAEEQDRRDGVDGEHEWRAFRTWAEAITYADRMVREGEDDDGDLVMENHYHKTLATTILEYKILIATLEDKLRQVELAAAEQEGGDEPARPRLQPWSE